MWQIFRHYKGPLYLRYFRARHSETSEDYEVYRCLYETKVSPRWIRPTEMFFGAKEDKKRFEPVGTIAIACPEDLKEVLMFGYDAWGDGMSPEAFIKSYDSCRNHLTGRRYVLRNEEGRLVAGLNHLRFTNNLSGIASVATHPKFRKKGYSSLLMTSVLALLEDLEGGTRQILFSEISPDFYTNFGFETLPESKQKFLPSQAMLRGSATLADEELIFIQSYF